MQTENEQIESDLKDLVEVMIELTAIAEADIMSISKRASIQLERLARYGEKIQERLYINKILELCRTGR